MRRPVIGVMGGGDDASENAIEWAYQLGQLIAQRDWVLLSGGRKVGVMHSSCKGAKAAGGLVVGVLPGNNADDASDAVDVVIATGMGSARNNVNVLSSDVVIACGETSVGTLSEIGLAIKAKRPVVLLNDDKSTRSFLSGLCGDLLHLASSPEEAIGLVEELLNLA